ncbi:hypothetical protein [Lysobacter gummosus]|uniref:hypothetical protein n=1 Tax=Lysobacter gummosus TaxID=262324 RepID=UPI0036286F6B
MARGHERGREYARSRDQRSRSRRRKRYAESRFHGVPSQTAALGGDAHLGANRYVLLLASRTDPPWSVWR